MNNLCPSCGAVYNVAPKDVGRRIRCKKCTTALVVTDAGLEADQPAGGVADLPPPAPPADDLDDLTDPAPRRKPARRPRQADDRDADYGPPVRIPVWMILKWVSLGIGGILALIALGTNAIWTAALSGLACFLAIVARICQAEEHKAG